MAKDMNEDLAEAFSTCIKIVNFIKARPLNHRLFENMCREMEAEHKHFVATHGSPVAITRSRCSACL